MDDASIARVQRVVQSSGATVSVPLAGRPLEVRYAPGKIGGFAGSLLFRMRTPLQTRLAVIRRGPGLATALDHAAGLDLIDGTDLGYPGLELSMAEPDWARPRLTQSSVRHVVNGLVAGETATEALLILRPGALVWRLIHPRCDDISHATIGDWLAGLAVLIEALEQAPHSPNRR